MANEEDNFDIDIYGDEGEGTGNDGSVDYKEDDDDTAISLDIPESNTRAQPTASPNRSSQIHSSGGLPRKVNSEDSGSVVQDPKQSPVLQGAKRKRDPDERAIDPSATNAIMISDLHWWETEDDIRGWANQADCEDELRDVTFSEHKVNGKSKGQAFVEFESSQASTAMKHKIDSLSSAPPNISKRSTVYTNPFQNPFKTSSKDGPTRGKDDRPPRSTASSFSPSQNNFNNNATFRGGRGGGYNSRGGFNNNNSFNNNRNFSGPVGGFNNAVGFHNNMPMMNNFGGYNRGGMNGMRGGRGGMGAGVMPMSGMGMANMGMNSMMGNMGFQGNNAHFNAALFNPAANQNQGWNPQGVKRQRHE